MRHFWPRELAIFFTGLGTELKQHLPRVNIGYKAGKSMQYCLVHGSIYCQNWITPVPGGVTHVALQTWPPAPPPPLKLYNERAPYPSAQRCTLIWGLKISIFGLFFKTWSSQNFQYNDPKTFWDVIVLKDWLGKNVKENQYLFCCVNLIPI